jgi:hypothetical protein
MRTIPKNIVFIGILAILALTAIPAFSALAAASVQTSSASAIGETSATLNAQVYGGSEPIYYRFEFGTSPALGNTTSFELVYGSANISATVFSLSPNTIYYYRAVIQDRFGKLIGGVPLAFMTGSNGRAGTMLGNGYNGNFNNGNNNNVTALFRPMESRKPETLPRF